MATQETATVEGVEEKAVEEIQQAANAASAQPREDELDIDDGVDLSGDFAELDENYAQTFPPAEEDSGEGEEEASASESESEEESGSFDQTEAEESEEEAGEGEHPGISEFVTQQAQFNERITTALEDLSQPSRGQEEGGEEIREEVLAPEEVRRQAV